MALGRWLKLSLLLPIMSASASSFRVLPLDDIQSDADVIAVGTIASLEHTLRGEHPFTVYELQVDTPLRGYPGPTMALAMYGGPMPDGSRLELVGAPTFSVGEQLIVHAVRDAVGAWRLVDWHGGLLRRRLSGDRVAVVVDGQGSPIEALPCEGPAVYAPTRPSTTTADGATPRSDETILLGALPWSDAVTQVAACGGGAK